MELKIAPTTSATSASQSEAAASDWDRTKVETSLGGSAASSSPPSPPPPPQQHEVVGSRERQETRMDEQSRPHLPASPPPRFELPPSPSKRQQSAAQDVAPLKRQGSLEKLRRSLTGGIALSLRNSILGGSTKRSDSPLKSPLKSPLRGFSSPALDDNRSGGQPRRDSSHGWFDRRLPKAPDSRPTARP